jgi:outer membrane protein insertion porin family
VGLNFVYNSLDNFRNPTSGFYGEIKPEVAGLGGDSRYFRVSGEGRAYYELYEEIIGIARVQGGHIAAFGGDNLRVIDHYFLGPSLVRGFAPSGLGPRDVGTIDARSNAIGGTTYFGGSLEVQFPIFGLPRDLGLKGAVFADAGTLFGYKGNTRFDVNRQRRASTACGALHCHCNRPIAAGMPNVRDNKQSARPSAPASSGPRPSARSASTTRSRSARMRASSTRTVRASAATALRRSASRAVRASDRLTSRTGVA